MPGARQKQGEGGNKKPAPVGPAADIRAESTKTRIGSTQEVRTYGLGVVVAAVGLGVVAAGLTAAGLAGVADALAG